MTSTAAKLSALRAPAGVWGASACIARTAIAGLLLLALWAAAGLAQVAPPPKDGEPAPAIPPGSEPIRESPLAVFYLKDKDGNLVRVANMTFEEFEALSRIARGLAQPEAELPRYTLERLTATGRAAGDWAELELDLTITVRDAEWVRVPLRLAGAVLREPPKAENAADFLLKVEADGSLLAWVKGDPKKPLQLHLALNAPLTTAGPQRRLTLAAPRATQFSLALTVPGPRIQAEATGGAALSRVELSGQQSIVRVDGSGGDFELAWREAGVEAPRALAATVNVLVTLEGPQRAAFDAHVRPSAGPGQTIDKFRVRLPPNVELAPDPAAGYTWAPLAANGNGRTIEITLAKPSAAPDVRLVGRMNGTSDRNVELAGFEVLGAAQTGHIAVVVEGDWSLRWLEGKHVTRVDDLPSELKRPGVRAGFRFFRGDYSLPVSVLPRRMHLAVEPTYALTIDRDSARLEATLKCQVRGAKAYFVELSLPGWQVDKVEPDTLVDIEDTLLTEVVPLRISLPRGVSGEFEVKVTARRPLDPALARLTIPLPTAVATVVHPPLVQVTAADNVRLTPVPAEMPALAPDAGPAPAPPGGGQVLVYRAKPEAAAAAFVADRTLQGRQIQVAGQTDITLSGREAIVEERLGYSIRFEPLARVTWRVPAALAAPGALVVRIEDQIVPVEFDPAAIMADEGGERLLAGITLPQPREGALVVQANYRLPLALEGDQPASAQRLSLIVPAEGTLNARTVRFLGDAAGRVSVGEGSWLRRTGLPGAPAVPGEFVTEGAAEEMPFELAAARRVGIGPRIERLWLQTLVTAGLRQDRAVFRVALPESRVLVTLPEGVAPEEADVIVDGARPTAITPRPNHKLLIEWAPGPAGRTHTLELWYPYAAERAALAPVAPEAPRIVGAEWTPRFYWQVVAPASEIALAPPAGLLPEFTWQWRGLGWSPAGRLDQPALEDWSGASHQAALPEGMNRYLFSGFGAPAAEPLRLGDRRLWFLLAAGAILVVGLLFVYVPAVRHPALVAVLVLVVAAVAMIDGTLALLAAQGAVAGLVLAAMAFVLDALLVRPRAERAAAAPAADSRSSQHRPDSKPREIRTTEAVPSISRDSSRTPALHTVPLAPPAPELAAPVGQDAP